MSFSYQLLPPKQLHAYLKEINATGVIVIKPRLTSIVSTGNSAGGSATGSAGDPSNSGVDEQGADPGGSRYLAFQNIDVVDQIIPFQSGIGQYHDNVQHMITLKNRQGGIGRISGKTVLALAPRVQEILNGLMTRQVLRPIGEPDHGWTHILKDQKPGAGIKFNAFGALHKKHNFFSFFCMSENYEGKQN
jgi:hypothetical protein